MRKEANTMAEPASFWSRMTAMGAASRSTAYSRLRQSAMEKL